MGVGWSICFSNEFSGGTDALGPGASLWEPEFGEPWIRVLDSELHKQSFAFLNAHIVGGGTVQVTLHMVCLTHTAALQAGNDCPYFTDQGVEAQDIN